MVRNDRFWRLVITPPKRGAWNMACDEAFGDAVRSGTSIPVVRFFAWNPPTISFGYGQHIAREVDLELVRGEGIGLVRRVTGGRAVLHADEITYSVICREDDPVAAGGIIPTYGRISAGLAQGLRKLNVNAEIARSPDPAVSHQLDQATLPCFGSTSRAEIVVDGRKIVGSAQHRMRGLVLQHGSILLGPKHRGLVRYLRVDEVMRERYLRRITESTTSLAELGWDGTTADATAALAEGLSAELGITWQSIQSSDDGSSSPPITDAEEREIERLAREKYAADWWNLGLRSGREVRHETVAR